MPWGVAAAAVVSAGAGAYEQNSAESAQKNAIAPTQAAQNSLYSQAEDIASTPYTPYTGQQTAGLTANQQQGITQAAETSGPNSQADQYISAGAQEAADLAGNTWNTTTAQNYMNPYTQNVTDIALRQENQAYAQSENQAGLADVTQGAFGGDRAALTQAEITGQHDLNQGDIEAQGQAAAYTNAQQLWSADNQRMATASQDYDAAGNDITNMNSSQISNLLQSGNAAQVTQQMALTAGYNDYLDQRSWAQNELAPLESAVGKTPVLANPSPVNYASDLVGAGSALAGYYGMNSNTSALTNSLNNQTAADNADLDAGFNNGEYAGIGSNPGGLQNPDGSINTNLNMPDYTSSLGDDFGSSAGIDSGGDLSSMMGDL